MSANKLIFGAGVNDAEYNVNTVQNEITKRCHYYTAWIEMIRRCYSSQYHIKRPTYINCTVCDEWLSFSTFKNWMEMQDWKGKDLDKDVLLIGNKIYSPKTCVFIPRHINSLLTHIRSSKKNYPAGVSFSDNGTKKFMSRCNIKGKSKYLGRFITIDEASEAYKTAKSDEIERIAFLQTDSRIKDGLLRHADNLLNS